MYKPYSYIVSDFSQLPDCLSNNSPDFTLHTTKFIQSTALRGICIAVHHSVYGTVFSYIVNCSGTLVTEVLDDNFTLDWLSLQLKKFGFNIQFKSWPQLSGEQLSALSSLDGILSDAKLRYLSVRNHPEIESMLVIFDPISLPDWLVATYQPTHSEFELAIQRGACIIVSKILKVTEFDYSWLLGWVASISDILREASYNE